ncbi:Kinesin motor family protein [Forsythia ovata]|uniref:Kinesin motor family protein n=1 Tax=Forsythia ovata TaxID=205694 RepID=A0ABD1QCX6_9LAMI
MQSRLEEEEEAKAALMSRIQRLTKLILVSSKNPIPRILSDVSSHHRSHYASKDNDGMTMSDQMDILNEQVEMLAGEIASGTSMLTCLIQQSVNDLESSRTQVWLHSSAQNYIVNVI